MLDVLEDREPGLQRQVCLLHWHCDMHWELAGLYRLGLLVNFLVFIC